MRRLAAARTPDGYRCELIESPAPVPSEDEVLVEVAASGVNRADLSQIAGRYPAPPGEPDGPGLELSGTVAGTGERICALVAGGAHAELAAVPRGQLLPAPRSLDLVSASAIPEAFLTAYLNVVLEAALAAGERVLVHAGASGVGLAAIRMARLLGSPAAATTRSAGKLPAIREAGAELAIDASREDFPEAIARAWGERAVDVVLDPVGAATLAGDLRVLATGGRIVTIATLSGAEAALDLADLMARRARLIGSTLRARPRPEKAALVARFREEILPAFDAGALAVDVDSIFPAARSAEAFARMAANRNTGKMLLVWR